MTEVMVWDCEGSEKATALPSDSLRILTLGEGSCSVQNLTLLRLTWWICCILQRVAMINVQPWEWVKWDNHFLLSLWITRGPSEIFPNSCVCVLSCFSHVQVCVTLWTVAGQAPLSIGFSMQKYWSVLPCPPPVDLADPGIEPTSITSTCTRKWVLYH